MVKKINKTDIAGILEQWNKEFEVFVPTREGDISKMALWDRSDASFLDWYRNTIIPARSSLLPVFEAMFRFQKDKDGYQMDVPAADDGKKLLFAIRPCDARALSILDMTFGQEIEDPYYCTRRKNALLVGLGCVEPYDSCFCTSLGSGPCDAANVDIMFADTGDDFLIEEITKAGKELLARTKGLTEATKADIARAEEVKRTSDDKVTRKLDSSGIEEKLAAAFDDKASWEKVAAKCISCGICTLLCPTCYCFDISDEMSRQQGARFRCWDSCAFPLYTKMPMENPREEKWRRVRQKVCHKYEFYPMNFDIIACTGCGRCIRLCPVNWDITRTLESVLVQVAEKTK
ncbi:4Fe-4S dicluster domain-containing protein [Chloroflexota bacterium]